MCNVDPLGDKRYFASRNSEILALECAIAIQRAFARELAANAPVPSTGVCFSDEGYFG
jgi:hypothetical protein